MKNKNLLIPAFFIAMGMSLQSQAQVTITKSNFPRQASFTDSMNSSVQTGIPMPTEGSAQVWDYSSLKVSNKVEVKYTDATSDANFTNALNYHEDNLEFQGMLIESNIYETIDKDGWFYSGRSLQDITYSITSISGGANDSLHFVGGIDKFNGRIDNLKFPMNFNDKWTQSNNEFVNFELTVQAYGLNKTPGYLQKTFTNSREVVGYGKLTIPKADGTPSSPMDVLLLKVNLTQIDSFYLGGAPAPMPIMSAFGLTQGNTTTQSYYIFYKPDLGTPIMNVNINDKNEPVDAAFRSQAAEPSASVNSISLTALNTYPNPVEAGQNLNIQLQSPVNAGSINIYSIDGRLVFHKDMMNGDNLSINIPKNLAQGLYIFQVNDQMENPVAKGKLQIK